MALQVLSKPNVVLNESLGWESRWNCAFHPILFKFQRRDLMLSNCTEYTGSGTGWQLEVTGDYTNEIEIGDRVYVYNVSNIDTVTTVEDVWYGSGITTIIIAFIPGSELSFTYGFINLLDKRTGYYVELDIIKKDKQTSIVDGYPQFRDNLKGIINANVQEWIASYLKSLRDNVYQAYSSTLVSDDYLGAGYYIKYREYWNENGYENWQWIKHEYSENNNEEKFQYINAVKYVQDLYGQNAADWMGLAIPGESIEKNTGKFLTMFEMPTYFNGYPWDISFIYDWYLAYNSVSLRMSELDYDINYQSTNGFTVNLSDVNGHVARYRLQNSWDVNTVYRVLMLFAKKGFGLIPILIPKTILIDESCHDNPEYFRWLNPMGGFDYWLFDRSQEFVDEVSNEKTFEPFIEDLEDSNGRAFVLSKDKQETFTITAEQLSKQQAIGLRYMLSSVRVQRYLGRHAINNAHLWQEVRIKTGSFPIYETGENKFSFKATVLPPQHFNQSL